MTSNKCILVIEDDPGIRETFKFALTLEGYNVLTAGNGKEGLDLLPTIPKPGLILLDLMMPVMNGWEFLEEIKKDSSLSSIPIVVVTAFADKSKTIQVQEVINKPVTLDTLYKVVKHWCV